MIMNLKDSLMIATKDSFKINVNVSQIRVYPLAGPYSELMTKKATRVGRFLILGVLSDYLLIKTLAALSP